MTVYGFGRGIQVSGTKGLAARESRREKKAGLGLSWASKGIGRWGEAVFAAGKVLELGVAVGPEINREWVHTM
jgi:hypothetical protein